MTSALLLATWLAPLLLLGFAWRAEARWLPAIATIPALLTLVMLPAGTHVKIDWLLLGVHLGIDDNSRLLLLGSALTWLSAALFSVGSLRSDPRAAEFRVFFLMAMAGNFLLLIAQDAMVFYLGYALMGLAAFGLVAHRRSTSARRAGRVYLAWTLVGELLLFGALVMLTSSSSVGGVTFEALRSAPASDVALLFIVLAFGIKLGVIGLHTWMPLAYAAAPSAGSAVLAGAMINAGLLGLLRLLPLDGEAYAGWGQLLIGLGLLAAFYAVAVGLLQRRAKVVLAYSSMSQMGLVTAGTGMLLLVPDAAPLLAIILCLYAVHHGLAKGALFLAADGTAGGLSPRWRRVILTVLALALAGAPLTSGGIAKALYKDALPDGWDWLLMAMTVSTVATTLLMARFLALVAPPKQPAAGNDSTNRFAIGLPLIAGPVILLAYPTGLAAGLGMTGWLPVAVGVIIAWLVWQRRTALTLPSPTALPPGDIPVLLVRWLQRSRPRLPGRWYPPKWQPQQTDADDWSGSVEIRLRAWPVAGATWLMLLLALLIALAAL